MIKIARKYKQVKRKELTFDLPDWEKEDPFADPPYDGLIDDPYDAGVAAIVIGGFFALRWVIIAVMLLVVSGRRKKRLAMMGLDRNGHRRLQ